MKTLKPLPTAEASNQTGNMTNKLKIDKPINLNHPLKLNREVSPKEQENPEGGSYYYPDRSYVATVQPSR